MNSFKSYIELNVVKSKSEIEGAEIEFENFIDKIDSILFKEDLNNSTLSGIEDLYRALGFGGESVISRNLRKIATSNNARINYARLELDILHRMYKEVVSTLNKDITEFEDFNILPPKQKQIDFYIKNPTHKLLDKMVIYYKHHPEAIPEELKNRPELNFKQEEEELEM